MGAGRLQGTPWHVEYLKKDDTDPRHDKRNCEYYKGNNNCRKRRDKICIGGRYCTQYLRKPERTKKQLEHKARELEDVRNFRNLVSTNENIYIGNFIVKYIEDDDIVKFAVGETVEEANKIGATLIGKDKPLFKKVLVTEEDKEFEIEGTRILLINKSIRKYKLK